MKKDTYHIIGVMSGTSLDGIDLAEINISAPLNVRDDISAPLNDRNLIESDKKTNWNFKIVNAETIPYSDYWRKTLGEAIHNSPEKLEKLDFKYTDLLADVINKFIRKNQISQLDAVCSHGHTILHQPERGLTYQIGNLPKLAKLINQKVVCDFRVADVELGGQGAPLVPIGDKLLFSEFDYCLNLGGFANVSSEENGKRKAYDICPVNIVLNKYAQKLGKEFDESGKIAASGNLNLELLQKLDKLQYYSQNPPKSLGLEWVNSEIFPILDSFQISSEAILRTFTEHVAMQLSNQFEQETSVLVTGGGAYNLFLIARLRALSTIKLVIPSIEIIEFKEALVFGLLGVLKLRGEINCLASVTGAKRDHSSGKII